MEKIPCPQNVDSGQGDPTLLLQLHRPSAVGLCARGGDRRGWAEGSSPPGRTKQALELGDSTLLQSHFLRKKRGKQSANC